MKNATLNLAIPIYEDRIIIGIATTPEEKKAIYRLRYNIYSEEISFNLMSADHQNKLFYDELDEWAILLYAQVNSTLIGTARINIGTLTDFPPDVIQTYRMNEFNNFYKEGDNPNFSVIAKGMIIPQYRSSSALNLLMTSLYQLYLDYHVQFAFVNCNFHLIPLHEHFGSRRIDKNILDVNMGSLTSFVMLVDDIQHLRTVGSPLFHAACSRTSLNTMVTDWFHSEFSQENKRTINSQLITIDELWIIIGRHFGDKPNHIISIISDLSSSEAKHFLHFCSTIVHCHAGDSITMGGNTSQELIILLSGTAHSSSHGTLFPGQCCGDNGLVNRTTHSSDVIAVSDTNILVLSFHYFKKFIKIHPTISSKILLNFNKSPHRLE